MDTSPVASAHAASAVDKRNCLSALVALFSMRDQILSNHQKDSIFKACFAVEKGLSTSPSFLEMMNHISTRDRKGAMEMDLQEIYSLMKCVESFKLPWDSDRIRGKDGTVEMRFIVDPPFFSSIPFVFERDDILWDSAVDMLKRFAPDKMDRLSTAIENVHGESKKGGKACIDCDIHADVQRIFTPFNDNRIPEWLRDVGEYLWLNAIEEDGLGEMFSGSLGFGTSFRSALSLAYAQQRKIRSDISVRLSMIGVFQSIHSYLTRGKTCLAARTIARYFRCTSLFDERLATFLEVVISSFYCRVLPFTTDEIRKKEKEMMEFDDRDVDTDWTWEEIIYMPPDKKYSAKCEYTDPFHPKDTTGYFDDTIDEFWTWLSNSFDVIERHGGKMDVPTKRRLQLYTDWIPKVRRHSRDWVPEGPRERLSDLCRLDRFLSNDD